jgi:DoxX-like family
MHIQSIQKSQLAFAPGTRVAPAWRRRLGLGLSSLAVLFFLFDAAGKLLRIEPVMKGTVELGWPVSAVVPLGLLLLLGALLYALPRTAALGAIYLTGFLGGAIATHYRIGSPLFTHVLFGAYVAAIMWGGLLLRFPRLVRVIVAPGDDGSPQP